MTQEPKIQISAAQLFRIGSILLIWAYGILLLVPVLAAFVAISLLKLGLWTLLIPALTLLLTAWFVPLGQGNSYIASRLLKGRLAQEMSDGSAGAPRHIKGAHLPTRSPFAPSAEGSAAYIVQLTLKPRLRTGIRAALEDADDFGFLTLDEEGFAFQGDSISISVPYENIQAVSCENVGLRGRFIYGPRITLQIDGLANVESLQFAERSSITISQSKRTAHAIARQFASTMQDAAPVALPSVTREPMRVATFDR